MHDLVLFYKKDPAPPGKTTRLMGLESTPEILLQVTQALKGAVLEFGHC